MVLILGNFFLILDEGWVNILDPKYPKAAAGTKDKYSIPVMILLKPAFKCKFSRISQNGIISDMNQETLNIILAAGFFIIVICTLLITYYLIKALRSITFLSDFFREKVKMNILGLIPAILIGLVGRFFKKRG